MLISGCKVGNEFGAVEALWSQFEGVMAQESEEEGKEGTEKEESEEDEAEEEAVGGETDRGDASGKNR